MRALLLILVLLFQVSCRNSPSSNTIDCDVLNEMMERDQYHRRDRNAIPGLYVADSLYRQDFGTQIEAADLPREYVDRAYHIVKNRAASDFVDIVYADSIVSEMIKLDSILSLELVSFIENHNDDLLAISDCFQRALIIFVHTSEARMPYVDAVMSEHRNAISDNMYYHIQNTFKHWGYLD